MQVLEFMFTNGWHFFGMTLLVFLVLCGIGQIVRAFRPFKR